MTGRGHWARDFALGGAFANAAGMASAFGLFAWMEGGAKVLEHVVSALGIASVFVAAGALMGAMAGRVGQDLLAAAGERWWLLLPVGFPLGAAVGMGEMVIAVATVLPDAPDLARLLGVGAMAGGFVLGLVLPLYLLLDVSDRPGWAALIAAPVVAPLAVGSIIGVVEWMI